MQRTDVHRWMPSLLALTVWLWVATAFSQEPAPDRGGVAPDDADGSPLNLDFEAGSLANWTAEGDAFTGQPVEGDTVIARRGDMHSQHVGKYWIGTFERAGDQPQGVLTSAPFAVSRPWASFLVAGGSHAETCVELVREDTGKVFFRASGDETEDLKPVAVDLSAHRGKKIRIRIVDRHSGGWGHVNFDDFRFHDEQPKLPEAPRPPALDVIANAGLTPEEAARAMTVPEGFNVTLFAGEPDVQQPIGFCLDDRGRLWVAEAYSYPTHVPEDRARDRIVVFEDVDGDGHFDERKVFLDKLNLVSGLEVGFGGVWIGAAPNLMFVPDKNGDDVADGPPQVLLDGWAFQDTHETLNAFIWGPDGWLYGCHGVFTHSNVGKPGATDEQRQRINAGIWRYHPTRHEFEVFAEGTSNPWGVDFNDQGQAFLTACVIPHLYHVIQGARYQRQAGAHFNPFTYEDIQTIAKHRHWIGDTPHAGNNRSDAAGGGHAHSGAMIYLGGAWPARYRNRIFMNNIHGARINQDQLTANGSGYVGDRAPDFLLANDVWSQILNLRYGPDGQTYLIDWYDQNQCHHREVDAHDRSNGRIFKVSYGQPKPVRVDLAKKSNAELVELQLQENDWYVRHARRLLQESGGDRATRASLAKMAFTHADETRRLRGLWALHAAGGLDEKSVAQGLSNDSALVRAWTIQLSLEQKRPSPATLEKLADLAARDPSPVVRLYLASAAIRLPPSSRWTILEALVRHAADATDHNLPPMYWYGAEPLAEVDSKRALALAEGAAVPRLLGLMVRRVAETGGEEDMANLVDVLNRAADDGRRADLLRNINLAMAGRRRVPMPSNWSTAFAPWSKSDHADLRTQASALAVTFGDATALAAMRSFVADGEADAPLRRQALAALVRVRDADLPPVLLSLLTDSDLRREALRGLAAFDDAATPAALLAAYEGFSADERRDALATLASRVEFALPLLAAVKEKRVAASDLSADLVRQLRNLKHAELAASIGDVWGVVNDTPEEKTRLIAGVKKLLAQPAEAPADPALGRALYKKTCAQCHVLFGAGGKIGPEITGSNRANLDYLLGNVLDPSALIGKEYQATIVNTVDGRVITGIVREETAATLAIVTATETVVLPKNEIDERELSAKSMMPDDQWKAYSPHEVRSVVAYLSGPAQVPLLATVETAPLLFNGRDLEGWSGNADLWRVDQGEIVGRSAGLARNEFLRSDLLTGNFRLTLEVKLAGNAGNSGIQFRSEALPDGEMRGFQADVGPGWWGKLYEENGRGLLWDRSGEAHVKLGEWNAYEIVAVGDRILTAINGRKCVDLTDAPGAKRGILALQLHSGGATEVRFRNLSLEVDVEQAELESAAE